MYDGKENLTCSFCFFCEDLFIQPLYTEWKQYWRNIVFQKLYAWYSGNGEKCNLSFQVKEPFPSFLTELCYSDISYKYIHVNTSVILLLLIIVLLIQAGFLWKRVLNVCRTLYPYLHEWRPPLFLLAQTIPKWTTCPFNNYCW